ncbi:putative SOS response-associated peptidase YedK [Paucimonas lemoignei]|uniref:Abasic site processing protein n=1 Tax=Paucimonas lemoignei TaxID=29443 RepID=A0A4R3HRN8_PAULE|nr:SOS response-associated peptidase [Paucimonas lemoignei]TCS35642.1 putative SOS response-associated peptidase YedK [Paucimonas lemoignei]
MCGRITQHRLRAEYAAAIGWPEDHRKWLGNTNPAYNVAPGTSPWVMHHLNEDQADEIDQIHWGYRPAWAAEKGIPMAINARIEKAATGRYFRHMWKSGRVIVPADGWYEWTGEKGHKQPWYIRLKADKPMLMAAITNWKPYKEQPEGTGFVIVTAAAEAGLLDVHDRRPVVLAPEDAQLWLDPDLPAEQAEYLARNVAIGPDAFEWYEVSTAVNKPGTNGPELIAPV